MWVHGVLYFLMGPLHAINGYWADLAQRAVGAQPQASSSRPSPRTDRPDSSGPA